MVEKWDITIPELTGTQTRRAYLYLPDYYDDDPDARYPVLYMFDGHNVFFDSDATYGKNHCHFLFPMLWPAHSSQP